MRSMVVLALGLGGCSTANPAFDPQADGDGGSSAVTADTTIDTTADPTDGLGTNTLGTTASTSAETDDATGEPETESSGGPIGDDCPGGGPLDPSVLTGTWWLCEHGIDGAPPLDGCTMLDDDGVRFEDSSALLRVWWTTAPTVDCEGTPGRCFACDYPEPGPLDMPPWGTWSAASIGAGAVEVTLTHLRSGCQRSLVWRAVDGQPYVRVEGGVNETCPFVGEGEPGIPTAGPWFMRKLQD